MRTLGATIIIFLLGVFAFPSVSFGTMSSSNYTIFADSINDGGVLSTSSTYNLQDTVGESPAGSSTSSAYQVISGYQAMDWSVLAIDIGNSNIDLGTLSTSQVSIATTSLSVTADADSGYVLSIGSVSGTSLAAVSDGSVTTGTEEYGVAVSGTDAAFADDRAITAGLTLASSSTPVTSVQTVVTFKAAVSGSSSAGSLSQSITVSASTNI